MKEDNVVMEMEPSNEEEIVIDNLYSGSFERDVDTGKLSIKLKVDEKFLEIVKRCVLRNERFFADADGTEYSYYTPSSYDDPFVNVTGCNFFYDPRKPPIVNGAINLGLLFNTCAAREEGAEYTMTDMISTEMLEYYNEMVNQAVTFAYQTLVAPVKIEFKATVTTQGI